MTNRPWALILLALIQLLTPLANVLFNAWTLSVPPQTVVLWWLERSSLEIFESFALMPLAGYALYRMKRWSYAFFFLAWGWNLLSNMRHWEYAVVSLPSAAWVIVFSLNLALILYLLLPPVRRIYLDASIRWWESKPRYCLTAPAMVRTGETGQEGVLLNLSEGGALLKSPALLRQGESCEISFQLLDLPFRIVGDVVHMHSEVSGGDRNYGIRFHHTRQSRKGFQKLVRGLELIGISSRDSRLGVFSNLSTGITDFLRSGKGLVPKNPARERRFR